MHAVAKLECYHCPNAHPSFADVIDLSSYDSEEYSYFPTQHGRPKADQAQGSRQVREGRYNFFWPYPPRRVMSPLSSGATIGKVGTHGRTNGTNDMWVPPRGGKLAGGRLPAGAAPSAAAADACLPGESRRLAHEREKARP